NDRQNQLLREALSLLGVNSPPNASYTTLLDFFEANKSKAATSKLQNDSLGQVNRKGSPQSQLAISSNLPIFSTLAVSPAITTDDVLTPLSISLPTPSANESFSNKFNTPPTNFTVTPSATTDELAKEELRKALKQLKKQLLHHPEKDLIKFLLDGFSYSFDIGLSQLPTTPLHCKNNSSARDAPEVVDKLIQDDVEKRFLLGPFTEIPFETYRISPIGVAYGKYSGKAMLIVDLSAPYDLQHHSSINSLIDKEQYSLSYVTLDDALKIVNQLGPHTSMPKCDMVDAFKQVPARPDLWKFLGICWRGIRLGVPLSPTKTVGPSCVLEYLGTIIDSYSMIVRLAEEKRLRILATTEKYMVKKRCSKREMLSVIGYLSHASRVIPLGRSFISYLIALAYSVGPLHFTVPISKDCRLDLEMWSEFLRNWEGSS
ncbi:unnamed protein product, partial [Didymodactylos carnosus]